MSERSIDDRLDALTANVEVMSGMLRDLLTIHAQNEVRYRLLASVVEQHSDRLDKLDGGKG